MPVVAYDRLATDLLINETIHVWECLGDYALSTKPLSSRYQSPDWKLLAHAHSQSSGRELQLLTRSLTVFYR
jgi:hypothetical protein